MNLMVISDCIDGDLVFFFFFNFLAGMPGGSQGDIIQRFSTGGWRSCFDDRKWASVFIFVE